MPTSVLLAVLVAAGLLALAPALVRRYDATERLEAERAQSTARVLSRTRRRRTVPGRRPLNPPLRALRTTATPDGHGRGSQAAQDPPQDGAESGTPGPRDAAPAGTGEGGSAEERVSAEPAAARPAEPAVGEAGGAGEAGRGGRPRAARERGARDRSGRERGRSRRPGRTRVVTIAPRSAPPARRRPRTSPAVYRRRRVLAALLLLNLVKLVGVVAVGPGFWIGFAVTAGLLLAYLGYLRHLAVLDRRHRRVEARKRAWLAAQQAEVRREQQRRAAARRAAARRMAEQRESLRRAADGWSTDPTVSYRRAAGDDR